MINKFQWLFVISLLVGMFFLGKECGSTKDIQHKEKLEYVHDTIWPDTMKVEVPKPYPIHDTVKEIEYYEIPLDSVKLRAFFKKRAYKTTYRDSSIEITVNDTIVGYLLSQKALYRSFKPLSIINSTVTTLEPQKSFTMTPKWEIKGGFDATPNNLFFNGELELNKNSYNIGYDPFNKQLKIGYKRTLIRSKKGI